MYHLLCSLEYALKDTDSRNEKGYAKGSCEEGRFLTRDHNVLILFAFIFMRLLELV